MFSAIVCCSATWASFASAQSSGSFPEPAAPPPAPAPPPLQTYSPPPPVYTPPAPAAPAPAAPSPARELVNPYGPGPVVGPTVPQLPAYTPPGGLQGLPPLLPYKHGLPVPPGYRVAQRSATGLTAGGGVTFLVGYAAGLGLAVSQGFANGTGYTAIPIAGPWAAIGGRTFSCKATVTTAATATSKEVQNELNKQLNKCVGAAFDEVTTVVFLTVDGLIQLTGAVLFVVGLASGYEELVREDLPKTAIAISHDGFSLSLSGNF